jgi:hypothetical protein
VPVPLSVVQHFDAPADQLYAKFSDRDFVTGRVAASGADDAELVTFETGDGAVTIVVRQSIPASVLPPVVSSLLPGDPVTERTERWRAEGDGAAAEFSVVVKGAPATLNGTMSIRPDGAGSVLAVEGTAKVAIPLLGGRIEPMVVEQVEGLLRREERYITGQLGG